MRRGSALLIVLGMMAFMVISAVAFSAYMRYSRLPSSYLRRSSSSRLLVKAALAEAIDEIDAAIGNNPHPGVGTHAYNYDADTNSRRNGTNANRNSWFHRVYMGFQNRNNEQDIENNLIPADDTVATLTLEGLAYVPEPLVNEARYYSRRSSAAQWKNLDFESGRYAFCAIDVSDYLDVNSLSADIGRGGTPATRFSLAYLFEDPSQHTSYQNDPKSWDDFIRKFWSKTAAEASVDSGTGVGPKGGNSGGGAANAGRASSTLVPLVSVADLNLALNFYTPGGLRSSFCDYVEQARSSFYGGIGDTGPAAEKVRNMTFVTDGLYPSDPDISAGQILDLADGANQPFTDAELQKNSPQLSTIMENGSKGAKWLQKYISGLGLAMLYDYLDEDNVPVSLALPSVERVPMVAGIQHEFSGAKLTIVGPASRMLVNPGGSSSIPSANVGQTITIQEAKTYKIDGAALATPGTVKVVLAYPFRRGRDLIDPDSFKVDGCLEYYFTSGNMTFRTGNSGDCLHVKSASAGGPLAPVTASDGVLSGMLSEKSFSPSNVNPQNEEDALYEVTLNSQQAASDIANALNNRNFITIIEQYTMQWDATTESYGNPSARQVVPAMSDGSATTSCGMPPLKPDGSVDPDFGTPATFAGWIANGTRDLKLRMNLWIRVRNGDNKTVDLVPACFGDDYNVCGQNDNNGRGTGPRGAFMSIDGGTYPYLRFDDNANVVQVSAAGAAVTGGGTLDLTPKAVMCPDPRWNYAPEHWFTPGTTISKSDWLSKCGRDTGVKDCDIFMATSDAGYLQSVYELAFLPRIMDDFSGNKDYGLVGNPTKGNAAWNTSLNDCSNNGLFWRTYRPFPRTEGNVKRDPFEAIGLVNEGGGMKVNPYADGTNTVLAALANTPSDWWAAAAEADSSAGVPDSDRKSAKNFNKKYAFNALSGGNDKPKFAWEDLKAVASRIIGRMRANRQNSNIDFDAWQDAWDDLGWEDDQNDFCGIDFQGDTDDLFDVDRKFLYGYWRECFAPKQQLFLVFVRAEPTMTGGSGIRQMPPQLGARAVALVWRDPNPTAEDVGNGQPRPHQTRVLFYRQLD